jgi:tRNA-2-methylthio-N6-dimethylallyladenosine synthase
VEKEQRQPSTDRRDPEGALRKTGADLAVIGEGERTLSELLGIGLSEGALPDESALSQIPGLAYATEDSFRVNPLRPYIRRRDYDTLSPSTGVISDYPIFYASRVYVETHRGCSNYHRARLPLGGRSCADCNLCTEGGLEQRYYCPSGIPPGCGYCSVPSLYGPPRSRSVGRIVSEVGELLRIGVRRVVLSAPDMLDYGRDILVEPEPLTDPRHPEPNYGALEDLLSRITDLDEIGIGGASLMIENLKGCLVTERAAEILGRYVPGTPVNVGFETGCSEHSALLGRASTPRENLVALRRLKRAGLRPYAYFIHGLPGQDEGTTAETVRAIDGSVRAGASRIILYRFQPLPMSAFQGLPTAPPAVKDRLSRRIYEAAGRANRSLKEDLKGRRIRVVVAEPYDRDRRLQVAYPMLHGPVVLVEGAEGLIGRIIEVEVTGIVSERMVRARPADVIF